MKEKGAEHVDEMLNAYLDGELSERHCTEIKRLLAHDVEVAGRFAQLLKCKVLVGSLPMVEVPEAMAFDVSEALERRALLGEDQMSQDIRAGAAHLFVRKIMAAAAMIAVVTALGAVIYTIVAPQKGAGDSVFVVQGQKAPAVKTVAKVAEVQKIEAPADVDAAVVVAVDAVVEMPQRQGAAMRLELATAEATAVNPFINKAIYDNLLLDSVSLKRQGNKTTYVFNGSVADIGLLIGDLDSIWGKIGRAKLIVEGTDLGSQIEIDNVSTNQMLQVVKAGRAAEQRIIARDVAAMNLAVEMMPGKEVLAVANPETVHVPAVAKPVLTSGQRKQEQDAATVQEAGSISLTITVVGI